MSPKAGAHGELCGMMAIKAAIAARGEGATRKVVLVPDSAHGTNPATAALIGFSVQRRARRATDGTVEPPTRARARSAPDVAAIMLTNPEHLRPVRARHRRRSPRRCTRPAPTSIATAPTSTPSSARRGRAISASTPCTSTCTRRSRRRMAAAARARARSCCRERLAAFAPLPFVTRDGRRAARWSSTPSEAGDAQPFGRMSRLPRPDGHVRARARLHAVARRRRHAAGVRGRGAERQLHPRLPVGPDERCPSATGPACTRRCSTTPG